MRRTRRQGGAVYRDPFRDRTDRAACFEVSPYQALCWREAFDDATKADRQSLAEVPIHGFATVFGSELTHRLCGVPVREVAPVPAHARLRARVHAMIPIPDHVRSRCMCNPALAASTAFSIMIELHRTLKNLTRTPDHERTDQERQAAKDLGLDGASKPKVKVKVQPSDGGESGPATPRTQPVQDGDTVQVGSGDAAPDAQEVTTDDASGSGSSGDDGEPSGADGLTPEEVRAAEGQEREIQVVMQDLDYYEAGVRATAEIAANKALPPMPPDAWANGGTGDGNGGAGTFTPSLTLASVMSKHPEIKRVLALSGRLVPILDRLAEDKRARTGAGRARLENTTEIPRLAMLERAGLAGVRGGIIAADTYRRILEGSALGYQGEDPRGEGAIVLCLDQSGSMFQVYAYEADGETPIKSKQDWAQAVALAIMVRASRTGRKVAIVPYDSRVRPELVRAFPRRMTVDRAVEALQVGSRLGGGTSWTSGLTASLDLIQHLQGTHLGRADIVHVTDGEPDSPTGHESIRERARAMNVRIHGIAVGHSAQAMAESASSPLALWSDTICAVTDTSCDSAAVQALGRI